MKNGINKLVIFVLIILFATTALASANTGNDADTMIEIEEIYSSIDSCDIALSSSSTLEDLILEVQLVREDRIIDSATIPVDSISVNSRVIKIIQWETKTAEDGAYEVRVQVLNDEKELSSTEYEFVHGRQVIPEVVIEGTIANSEGVTAVIRPVDATLVDIEYMLVDGFDVIYIAKDEKVSVHTTPLTVHKRWNTLLLNNKEYTGLVKVRPSNEKTAIVVTDAFISRDDAKITDVYKDEIGASATIAGNSQVPFDGYVQFTVYDENGENVVESAIMRSPILLTDDDETVEAIWENRLQEGKYKLVIEIIGNDGDGLDIQETIIDVEESVTISNDVPEEAEEDNSIPSFLITQAAFVLATVAFVLRRRDA
ncbi:hypothetical protein SAMN04488587_0233 [Methanococcoides vulcani]|uniref:Uncharacterized protein n=1 Tax=Methanococcoides vulcani TaxID=1353158 RepID=A0A1H9Y4G1_9EURY|nr:hypothetical protein [Methanococcoides vulcani]SES63716.1 hypothetical protein SAMN04488587_0233 [Methanococcoides vulcani]